MTDELDDLKAALRALPAADPAAKADAIAQAMKNFDTLQGSTQPLRPNQDRQKQAGFLNGVRNMLTSLTSRGFLAATTSVAALCLGLIVVLPTLNQPDIATLPTMEPETASTRPRQAPPKPEVAETTITDTELRAQPEDSNVVGRTAKIAAPDAGAIVTQEAPAGALAEATAAPNQADAAGDARMGVVAGMAEMATDAPAPVADSYASEVAQPEADFNQTVLPVENTEAFPTADLNPVKVTVEEPVSTFSIDVDTASYSVVRSSLMNGMLPPPEAVRVEEMINYFPYDYPAPEATEAPFRSTVTVMQTPWNPGTRLVHIGLQGRLPAVADRPPLNLVFLIDTSGSMDEPNKLPLLKQSLKLMLAELRPEDQVAMVAYAGSAGTVLEPTKAGESAKIIAALDNLAAGGSTAGAEGLALAYNVAETMAADGEVSRVLLATDGDFNVGIDDPEGLEDYIAKKRDTGVYLSVLGFGRGNLDDATMQALAQNGNGTAAYIDTLNEARKVLVDQLTGALFPIANDVKIQVEWNPAAVAEYRLIGYETRALNREDFNNDRVDAGEIGAGHSVTAIYEITAPGSPALRNDPLRYGNATKFEGQPAELGFLRLRYKAPGEDASALIETPITAGGEASDDARFAAAIAGFGQLLTGSVYLNDWGWDDAVTLALGARGDDPFGYRIEAVNLMRMAKTLDAQ
jgi:Ca-activated chloride channel homolog